MAFRIRENYEADVALTYLYQNRKKLSKLEQQLSTGLRIVRAADDAADNFIANSLKENYVGLQRGTMNAQYGLAAARLADDMLGKIVDTLHKIRDLLQEAASTRDATKDERKNIQAQINELVRNIAKFINAAETDEGINLLSGSSYTVQYGKDSGDFLVINGNSQAKVRGYIKAKGGSTGTAAATISISKFLVGWDGGSYQVSLATQSGFTILAYVSADSQLSTVRQSISRVERLIRAVTAMQGYYGAVENKLEAIIEANQIATDNLKEMESVVRNVDYASAMAEFQKMQVITQANVAALAQANQIPQLVMQLLR